jgi:formate/nitrite transporter FocA (FNT family)
MDTTFLSGITSGILCNVLVCSTVFLSICAKQVAGKLLGIFFGVFIFAVSGYEHCVANMYYITSGLLAKLNPLYVETAMNTYGITAAELEKLNLTTDF